VLTDGAEGGANGWTAAGGFTITTGTVTNQFDNYYIASNRQYVWSDRWLRSGPYNFGFPDRPDWVEHFPYQNGLLISYWDTSQEDNDTRTVGGHPGQGLILPVDANPAPIPDGAGGYWRPRVAGYDAPFGLERSESLLLHLPATGEPRRIPGHSAKPLFDDRGKYWYEEQPTTGVKLPAVGTKIAVLTERGTSMTIGVSAAR
jgi:immune inhibitor A